MMMFVLDMACKSMNWFYFAGHNEEHGIPGSLWPHYQLFLQWTFCTCQAFPGGVCPRSSKVRCLSCSNSSKHLFLLTKDAYFYSCELLLTSTASQEFDRTAHLIMLHTWRFSATSWACKRRLTVMPSTPQWLGRSEFAGQRLAGRTHSSVVHCHLTYYTVHHLKIQWLLRTISKLF